MSSQAVFKAALSRCRQRASQPSKFGNLSRYKQEAADEDLLITSSLPARDRKHEHALKLNDKGSNAYAPIELSDEDTDVSMARARVMTAEQAEQPVSLPSARKGPPKNRAAIDEVCGYAFQATNLETIENTEGSNVVNLPMQGQEHPELRSKPSRASEDVYYMGIKDHSYNKLQATSSFEEVEVGAQPARAIEHKVVSEPVGDNVPAYRDNALHYGKHEDSKDLFANQGSGSKSADESTCRAPVAYMGSGPFDSALNIIEPNRVGLLQGHVATTVAENVESSMVIEARGDGEERFRKAQKTLSEMEEILCEQKHRNAHNVKKLSDSGKPSHVNQPNREPFKRPITHAGSSGLQTGAAALGFRSPEVLREHEFVAQRRNHRPSSQDEIMHSNPSVTNRKELAQAANIRNAEGRRMHGSQKGISAADLFIRDSVTPPTPASLGDMPARRKRTRGTGTIPDYFTAKKRTGARKASEMTVTLKEGYFEKHEQRIKALKERAECENREFESRFDGQEQSLFLNSESDEDYQAKSHPETGGKGLSKETIKSLEVMKSRGNELQTYPRPSQSENDDLEMPKILYEYHVTRRVQLEGQFDNQARTTAFGPFYTIAEANTIAANEARRPSEELANVVFRPGAWSYSFDKDESGMETHTASGKGGTIHAWVTRDIAPPEQNISIPLHAFTTPAWVYFALVSSSEKGYASNDSQQLTDDNEVIRSHASPPETTIITSCTLLDLANRAAGRRWSELQAANIPNDGLGAIQKAEMDMRMRRDLDQMDKDNVAFDRTYRDPRSGIETHIWVEMMELEGPRN